MHAAIVITVGQLDNTKLFCGAKSLLVAATEGNETPFCILSGIVDTTLLSLSSELAQVNESTRYVGCSFFCT